MTFNRDMTYNRNHRVLEHGPVTTIIPSSQNAFKAMRAIFQNKHSKLKEKVGTPVECQF